MDKKTLILTLTRLDKDIADATAREVTRKATILAYNRQNPHDQYFEKEAYYPVSAEAKARFDKFATVKVDLSRIKQITNYNEPVLLTGETGTGKELLAQALHGDRTGKFVTVNCAAMTESLLDSELFGHVKGAFTGADSNNVGLFGTAKDGTVFVDELCAASKHLQTKLLRVIEYQTFRPVGSSIESRTNSRVVFATSGNIDTLLPDLLGRIPFNFHIPPLRDRLEDIDEILDQIDIEHTFPRDFKWEPRMLPYNVRSLKRAVIHYRFYEELPK